MSTMVACRKRDASVFLDDPHPTPLPLSKRVCCSDARRFSPTPPAAGLSASEGVRGGDAATPLARLRHLFPELDSQVLERVFEASGNSLDSAIKSLNELHSGQGSDASRSSLDTGANVPLPSDNVVVSCDGGAVAEIFAAKDNLPTDGSGWLELLLREMTSASDMDDARTRASRVLELLEKSIKVHAGAEATACFHKENKMVKEQMEALLHENSILKRAVAIQHEHQKDYDVRGQELQHLKQMVSQHQEQIRTLEVKNYALAMHLKQADQSSSIPGRFHPDVF